MKKLLFLFFAFVIFACNNNSVPVSPGSENKESVVFKNNAAGLSQFKEQEISWSGFFAIEGKSSWFRKDKNSFCYTLIDETSEAQQKYKKSLFIPYSNETAKISFKGILKFDGKDSIVVVKEIVNVEQKLFRNKDFSFEYFIKGNEPNWSLEILPDENVIAFKNFGTEKSYLFNYSIPFKASGSLTYKCADKYDKLEVVIEKKPCSDGMSVIKYDYTAKVTLNGKAFEGCGLSN